MIAHEAFPSKCVLEHIYLPYYLFLYLSPYNISKCFFPLLLVVKSFKHGSLKDLGVDDGAPKILRKKKKRRKNLKWHNRGCDNKAQPHPLLPWPKPTEPSSALAKTNRTLSILRLTHPYRKPNQKR
jgi:hypothetical protein